MPECTAHDMVRGMLAFRLVAMPMLVLVTARTAIVLAQVANGKLSGLNAPMRCAHHCVHGGDAARDGCAEPVRHART